jgi:serine protease
MNKTLRIVALAGLLAGTVAVVAPGARAAAPPVPNLDPTDQLIVRTGGGARPDDRALSSAAGEHLRTLRPLGEGAWVLKLAAPRSGAALAGLLRRLEARPEVTLAEPDVIMQPVANDPELSKQWSFLAPAGNTYGANVEAAWAASKGSGVVVAVIDTGYRPHADLAANIVGGYDFISDSRIANDGDGRDADARDPGDWIDDADRSTTFFRSCAKRNSSWHGTHVAGTVAAVTDNGVGVAGVAPAAGVLAVRVLGKCGGYTSDIVDGMRWAAGIGVAGAPENVNPAQVLNLSLGGGGSCSSTYQSAVNDVRARGASVVVSAGNANADAANYSPASCSGVITVASTARDGQRAYYSNYGTTVEIAAPGGDYYKDTMILSTLNTGTKSPGADSYASYQGTSMAAPHVSGVVALLLEGRSLTHDQVLAALQTTATPFPASGTCTTSNCGAGIVNAAAAVASLGSSGSTTTTSSTSTTSSTTTTSTTTSTTTTTVAPSAPGPFAKSSPSNGVPQRRTPLTLSWGTSAGADYYEYCLDSSVNGACDASWSRVDATSVTVSSLPARTRHEWQVRAVNTSGMTEADGGAWWTFTTR